MHDSLSRMADPPDLRCVLVGPPDSGKSSMLLALTTGTCEASDTYAPTVFDNYTATVEDGGRKYPLRLKPV